ncbi:MAG: hypothetical protein HQL39_15130, partial [Alphaproteobacteria bacterium]|nr:hypothetical protein [Alphaproteobacteria bacterium]
YTNGAGKWVQYASQAGLPMVWNSGGTATALTATANGDVGVFRLYVTKDSLNDTAPTYIAVADTASYNTAAAADTAIAAGTVAIATNELAGLELAQLGYATVQNNGSGGYIDHLTVQKSVFSTAFAVGGNVGSAALTTVNTANFGGALSALDTNVQQALETLDDRLNQPLNTSSTPTFAGMTLGTTGFTAFGISLAGSPTASAARDALALGSAATNGASVFAQSTHGHAIADVSGLQTALDGKAATGHDHSGVYQPADAELSAIAALTGVADAAIYFTGPGAVATTGFTAFIRSLADDADAATARGTLGLGSSATNGASVYQAADADLTAIAGLTSAADRVPYFTGSGTASLATLTSFGRNLIDDADAAAGRTTLGLGSASTAGSNLFAQVGGTNSFVGAQRGSVVTLTDAATVSIDLSLANNFTLTLGGNRTLGTPSNAVAGQAGTIAVIQDATGSRTLSYAVEWKPVGATPALSTAANAKDVWSYYAVSASDVRFTIAKQV